MEQETILYYYLQRKYNGCGAAKRHWWQEARLETLPAFEVGTRESANILTCLVPAFYYKKKEWKIPVLCETMENVLYVAEGMTDTLLSPTLEKLFSEQEKRRWRPRMDTVRQLTAFRMEEMVRTKRWKSDAAYIRLGAPQDADWQMESVWELLQPYLPRVNRCIIWYEPIPGVDIREEMEDFLEDYAYEYGLVVQMEPYGTKCEVQDGINIDFRGDNLYRQAWKYLDTMVKNKYDKLVN